jgi:hypothetical protein
VGSRSEFLGRLGLLGILIALAVELLVNSCAMWIAVNYLFSGEEREPFSRCLLCTVGISVVGIVVSLLGFVRIPLVGIVMLVLFFWGAKAVVEGMFERLEGGIPIVILYILTSALVWGLIGALLG